MRQGNIFGRLHRYELLKLFILLCLPSAIATRLPAQAALVIAPHIGVQTEKFDQSGLNSFFTSWNEFYTMGNGHAFDTINGFSQQGMDAGVNFIIYGDLDKSSFFLSYGLFRNKSTISRTSKIWSNRTNKLTLSFRDIEIPVQFGATIGRRAMIGMNFDFLFRKARLDFETIYQDGTKSIGNEFDLNGVYKISVPDLFFGPALALRFGKFSIPVSVTFPLKMFKNSDLPLTDYDANRFRSTYFPNDFQVWRDDVLGENEENAIFQSELKGMKFMVGIEYRLITLKE